MPKIALITDLHIGARADNEYVYKNMKKFYDDVFFPTIKERKIKSIINLGDTFDRRKFTNNFLLQKAKRDIFDKLNKYKCYFIVGNHDVYFNSTIDFNSTEAMLPEYANIKILNKPQTINVEGLNVCIIPWIVKSNEKETFKEIEDTNAVICMGHLELEGFEYFKNSICKHGYSSKVFSEKFIKTFSGHFHKKSITDRVSYLGSPYQTTWQEYEEIKGFHIFDTETFELEFIPNPNNLFVELMYPAPISNVEDNFVRIVVKDIDSRTNDFDLYKQSVYESKPANLSTKITDRIAYEATSDEEVVSVVDTEIEIDTDNLALSMKYIDGIQNFDKKDELKLLFNKLYMESQSVTD